MRSRWLTRRVVLPTVAVVIWVPGCLVAGWWQVTVAMSGNDFGYLYSVEWPIFAILGVVGWWQLIHDDPETVRARRLLRARARPGSNGALEGAAAGMACAGSPRPGADTAPALATGTTTTSLPAATTAATATTAALAPTSAPAPTASAPAPAAPSTPVRVPDAAGGDDELAAYNAYLASLAASGGRKTWRDPLGAAGGAGKRRPRKRAATAAGAGNAASGNDGSRGER